MSAHISPMPAHASAVEQEGILPTLFGQGYGAYRSKPGAFIASYACNLLVTVLLVWSGHWFVHHHRELSHDLSGLIDRATYVLPSWPSQAGGGGGGGDGDKLAASNGSPPKFARHQLAPPTAVNRNDAPILPVDPTVVGNPQIHLAQLMVTGDPLTRISAPRSNGPGFGSGIGTGNGGGVGPGNGAGVGPGSEGNTGGGPYRPGGGVTAPRAIYQPEPEYSDEARKAKFQGSVLLWLVVGPDGRPRDLKLVRSVGMGLDEKALETVRSWRFEPGRKDDIPVAVQVQVEVIFHLY
jgi:protein TonB